MQLKFAEVKKEIKTHWVEMNEESIEQKNVSEKLNSRRSFIA